MPPRRAAMMRCSLLSLMLLTTASAVAADEPRALGWVERVRLYPGDLDLEAKLDTGAKTASLGVEKVGTFERGEMEWARFTVSDRNSRSVTFERPVVRTVRIRRAEAKTVTRLVVTLEVCVADIRREVEVTLTDRSNQDHPMLLGRSSLEGKIVVDPSRTFTTSPSCPGD